MPHLFLSPHPDDAALSCGGQIASLVSRGEAVSIITVMAGDPPTGFVPTGFTRELEARWGVGGSPFVVRRAEDQAAARVLGAAQHSLAFPDAPYRVDPAGQALYPDWTSVISTFHPFDRRLISEISAALPLPAAGVVIHAPLGAGQHIDHRLLREVGLSLVGRHQVRFYEDYPYNYRDRDAVRTALEQFPGRLRSTRPDISAAAVEAKIAAIACHRSQLSTFWGTDAEMRRSIRDFTQQYGEPEWTLWTS
jgi:LmbE family N-acetylglucosaminyl deacetylase